MKPHTHKKTGLGNRTATKRSTAKGLEERRWEALPALRVPTTSTRARLNSNCTRYPCAQANLVQNLVQGCLARKECLCITPPHGIRRAS